MLYQHCFSTCFAICHQEGQREAGGTDTEWYTSASGLRCDVNILVENIDTTHKNTEALLNAGKEVGLEVNPEKTKYMTVSHCQKAGQRQSIKIP
jgi:hypothetical protein